MRNEKAREFIHLCIQQDPKVSAVASTNYCYVGLDVDERRGRVVAFGALDSIGKGGAHVGIENMNLMCGLERSAGLTRRGLHP